MTNTDLAFDLGIFAIDRDQLIFFEEKGVLSRSFTSSAGHLLVRLELTARTLSLLYRLEMNRDESYLPAHDAHIVCPHGVIRSFRALLIKS
jgi:hypothetical protein